MNPVSKRRNSPLIFLLGLLAFVCVIIFWPKKLSSLFRHPPTTANSCSITIRGTGRSVEISGQDVDALVSLIEDINVQYRGGHHFIFLNKGEHTYYVLLVQRGPDKLTELGDFILDGHGNLYIGEAKYHINLKDEAALLRMIEQYLDK